MSKRKHLIYGAITLIVIVISSVFCNNMYSINRMQKSQIIKENQAKWNLIYEMTQEIETYLETVDNPSDNEAISTCEYLSAPLTCLSQAIKPLNG